MPSNSQKVQAHMPAHALADSLVATHNYAQTDMGILSVHAQLGVHIKLHTQKKWTKVPTKACRLLPSMALCTCLACITTHTHTLIAEIASGVITFISHSVSSMDHFRWRLFSPFSAWHRINANEIVAEQISCSKMNNVCLFGCLFFLAIAWNLSWIRKAI